MSLSDWSKRVGALIAADLGVPAAALVFSVQARHEDADGDPSLSLGAKSNNPLNLDDLPPSAGGPWQGEIGKYLGVFAAFDTLEDGCAACATNYKNGDYAGVRAALASYVEPLALAQAIQDSPWDADHYGGHLVEEVRQEMAIDPQYVTHQQLEDYKVALQAQLDSTYAKKSDPVPAHPHTASTTVT